MGCPSGLLLPCGSVTLLAFNRWSKGRLPPATSRLPVSAASRITARWFCSPFDCWTMDACETVNWAGFEEPYNLAASIIRAAGTPVMSLVRSGVNSLT